ncbi:MAG: methionine--tRNA ligase, partial [Patescibacteria group bacterium]
MQEENKNNTEVNIKKSNGISFEEFKKIEIKVGKILSAEKIPDTDKLLKLMVDFGEEKPRQIVSGISLYFP